MPLLTGIALVFVFIISCAEGRVCPPDWLESQAGSSCYKITTADLAKSWTDARSACQHYQGDLVVINSTAEQTWLTAQLRKVSEADPRTGSWWFGATDDNDQSQWRWVDQSPVSAELAVWKKGEPNNYDGNEHCANMWLVGLNDNDCSKEMAYVCERPKSVALKCDVDNGWDNYHLYCYKYYEERVTWREADGLCKKEGGLLVNIFHPSIQQYVRGLANAKGQNSWIGLRSGWKNGVSTWKWTYGGYGLETAYWSNTTNPTILSQEQNSSCVEMSAGTAGLNNWNKVDCDQRKAFLCGKPEGICAQGWVQYQAKCYEIQTSVALTWQQAASYCQNRGYNGSLLEINSKLEQDFLNTYLMELSESGVHQVWIGIWDQTSGMFSYSSGAPFGDFTNWVKAPVDTGNKLDCGRISTGDRDGKWSITSNCLQFNPFICQMPANFPPQDVTTPTPQYSCDSGWRLYGSRCFLFSESRADWLRAQQNCQSKSGSLVVIHDNYTQAFITAHLSAAVTWTGLSDKTQEGTYVWVDQSPMTFRNWVTERSKTAGEKNCVVMGRSADHVGQWEERPCNEMNNYVCQRTARMNGLTQAPATTTTDSWSAHCGVGWEEDSSLGFCYSFQEQQLSWVDAALWCTHHGGDLASVESLREQYFLIGRIRTMSSFAVWIGANSRSSTVGWAWTDGAPFAFLNWKPGEPNNLATENCVNVIVSSGLWNNFRCDARNAFVCKKSNGIGPPTTAGPNTPTPPAGVTMGCPNGWRTFRNECYLVVTTDRLARDAALKECSKLGSNLVSIADSAEQNFVSSIAKESGQYWIGLDDRALEWTFAWTDGSPVTFTSWSPGEPNNFESKDEDCVTMYGGAHQGWNDQLCNFLAVGYICKSSQQKIASTTSAPGCPPNSYLYQGMCYIYLVNTNTWQMAESKCVEKGGHLATVTDRFVQAFLSSELYGRQGSYWIGLKKPWSRPWMMRPWGRSSYTWSSGKSLSFTFWARSHTGNEMNTCVAMSGDKPVGVWTDQPCSRSLGAICEVRSAQYSPSPTPSTTPDPNACPKDWNEYQGYCYRAFHNLNQNSHLTWQEAEGRCQGYGGHLVSFRNQSEADFVKDTVLTQYWRADFWIGLSQRDLKQGYSWTDGTGFGFNQWAAQQPDNVNDMENCVVYNSQSNDWYDFNCLVANNWICKVQKGLIPPTTAVPPTAVVSPSCTDDGWKYFNGWCYYVSVAKKKSWYEAGDWCRQRGARLLSIHSKQENDVITSLTAKLSYKAYWTGLNSLDTGVFKWADATPFDFINWAKGEPNGANGEQKCTNFYNDMGAWSDDFCGDLNEFICKMVNGSYSPIPTKPTTIRPGNCPKGFHGFKSKCFFLGGNTRSTQLTWDSARTKCDSFGKSYDLASISGPDEQAFVVSLLGGWNTSLWIGLNDRQKENKFQWQDNSQMRYTHWANGEPSDKGFFNFGYQSGGEDCVAMYSEDKHAGQWNDENCVNKFGYVCQTYRDPSFPTAQPTIMPSWCKAGYTVFRNSCFRVTSDPVTWLRAKSVCSEDGAKLASIEDVFEQSALRVLTRTLSGPVWIGLHDAEVSGSYSWVDNWPVFYSNWGEGEPSKGDGEGCVAYLTNGRWNDTKCNQLFPAVCKMTGVLPPPVTSPFPGHCRDSAWTKWGDSCYLVERTHDSFPDAKFACERLGMSLASIHSKLEADYVKKLINSKSGSGNAWIGMVKGITGGFSWVDGTAVDYVEWQQGEPSDVNSTHGEDCVELILSAGHWNDLSCRNTNGYVCKTSLVVPSTAVPTTRGPPTGAGGSSDAPATPTAAISQHTASTGQQVGRRTEHSPPGRSGLSTGAVVGICLGSVFALVILAAIAVVVKHRRAYVYKSGRPAAGFDNALFSNTEDTVNIQSAFENSNNGHLQSHSE